jgi:hypothetical protein
MHCHQSIRCLLTLARSLQANRAAKERARQEKVEAEEREREEVRCFVP